jgi:Cysteine rich repeat
MTHGQGELYCYDSLPCNCDMHSTRFFDRYLGARFAMRSFSLVLVVGASTAAQSTQVNAQSAPAAIQAACAEDALKLCAGVQPGGGRIVACLKEHKVSLSDRCANRSVLEILMEATAGVEVPDSDIKEGRALKLDDQAPPTEIKGTFKVRVRSSSGNHRRMRRSRPFNIATNGSGSMTVTQTRSQFSDDAVHFGGVKRYRSATRPDH